MDQRHLKTPVVAIVGRTNVGKSTLFNRLTGQRSAITSDVPGTTHDIKFGHCHWRDRILTVVDTAGLDLTADAATDAALKRQAQLAMKKADLILFVVDAEDGFNPQDRAFAKYLQKTNKPVVLVANKADSSKTKREINEDPEWMKLGYGAPLPVSAVNSTGTGDMLDLMLEKIASERLDDVDMPQIDIRVAILGRPNVGKSSLLNALAGEDRVIVSEIPHTTKEPQDTLLTVDMGEGKGVKNLLLIDTVGIRKRARVAPGIERIGVHMSLEEMKRADVVLLMVDASQGIDLQEKRLAGLIEANYAALLVVVNKWDLAEKKEVDTAEFSEHIRSALPAFDWAGITFISAKNAGRVTRLLNYAIELAETRKRTIPQEELDQFVVKLKKQHHTFFAKGGDRFGKIGNRPKVYGITQTGITPPEFVIVVHDKETIHTNFKRFVENRLREDFGFKGVPIRVMAREIE